MLTEASLHPSLAVADLARARSWYTDKLGWEPAIEPPGSLIYKVDEAFFTLYESEFAGTAKNTVMNWTVPDVRAEVGRLRDRGVEFEDYDFGDARTVDGIMSDPSGGASAWFKDADGNTIALLSMGPEGPSVGADSTISGMIAAADLDRARAWYEGKLGFAPIYEMAGVLVAYRSGDSSFTVYQTDYAGTAKNTVGIWRLQGIRDEVARLRDLGVVFEEYDFGDESATVDGILSDAEGDVNAWFTDSEGNILALAEDRGGIPA